MRTRHTASMVLAACLIPWVAGAQQAGTETHAAGAEAVAWLRFVAEEVRKLRREVLELRLELHEARTPQIERELLEVQDDRQRLEQEASVHSQEFASLGRQLAQPGLQAEEQQTLMARQAELAAEVSGRLRTRQNSLAERETAARRQLDQQQQRLQRTLAQSSELLPAAAKE